MITAHGLKRKPMIARFNWHSLALGLVIFVISLPLWIH